MHGLLLLGLIQTYTHPVNIPRWEVTRVLGNTKYFDDILSLYLIIARIRVIGIRVFFKLILEWENMSVFPMYLHELEQKTGELNLVCKKCQVVYRECVYKSMYYQQNECFHTPLRLIVASLRAAIMMSARACPNEKPIDIPSTQGRIQTGAIDANAPVKIEKL